MAEGGWVQLARTNKPSKYRARKMEIDGIKFDSKREGARFMELRSLERAGAISDLRRQVKFELIPNQRGADGKVIERAVSYYADYTYIVNITGELVVEDAKGYRDGAAYALFTIKRKLMLYVNGIRITEV